MLPLPLFDWGQARRGKADAAVSEASHELTQAERAVVEEVRRAHAVFTATLPIADAIRTQLVPLAELRMNQAEAQLTAGEAGLSDVLLAEQDLRSARMRLIEMDRKGALALISLERAVGGRGIASGLRAGQAAPTTPGALQASSGQ
jgi:outer membrane protein TolC